MTSIILGILGAAFLFGLFTYLRPRDKDGCNGNCIGCTRDGACHNPGVER
jgi:hypothetical protein